PQAPGSALFHWFSRRRCSRDETRWPAWLRLSRRERPLQSRARLRAIERLPRPPLWCPSPCLVSVIGKSLPAGSICTFPAHASLWQRMGEIRFSLLQPATWSNSELPGLLGKFLTPILYL